MAESFSFKVYKSALFAIFFSLMLVLWIFILNKIWDNEQRRVKIAFWFFIVSLVVASYQLLIVFSVEAIHFIQHASLAVPVFALALRFGQTVFRATLVGTLDASFMQTTGRCTSTSTTLCSISSEPA